MEEADLFKNPYSYICDEHYLQMLFMGWIMLGDCKMLKKLFETEKVNIYAILPNGKYPLVYARECLIHARKKNCSKKDKENRKKVISFIKTKLNVKTEIIENKNRKRKLDLLPVPETLLNNGHKRSCSY